MTYGRKDLNGSKKARRRASYGRLLDLSLEDHPLLEGIAVTVSFTGSTVFLKKKDGTVRSRRFLLIYPEDPNRFSLSTGRFFLDVRPHRGRNVLRLYWHGFDKGRDLVLTGVILGRTLNISDRRTYSC